MSNSYTAKANDTVPVAFEPSVVLTHGVLYDRVSLANNIIFKRFRLLPCQSYWPAIGKSSRIIKNIQFSEYVESF